MSSQAQFPVLKNNLKNHDGESESKYIYHQEGPVLKCYDYNKSTLFYNIKWIDLEVRINIQNKIPNHRLNRDDKFITRITRTMW